MLVENLVKLSLFNKIRFEQKPKSKLRPVHNGTSGTRVGETTKRWREKKTPPEHNIGAGPVPPSDTPFLQSIERRIFY